MYASMQLVRRTSQDPACGARLDVAEEFGELPINHKIEQCFPLGKVVIDGHGSDTDRLGYAAHAHRVLAFLFENLQRFFGNALRRGCFFHHLYTVYLLGIRCIAKFLDHPERVALQT